MTLPKYDDYGQAREAARQAALDKEDAEYGRRKAFYDRQLEEQREAKRLPPGPGVIDLRPLHGKVVGTVSLFTPWNTLHRETFALLPVAACPELAMQLGLVEEDCYEATAAGPCLVLPTQLSYVTRGFVMNDAYLPADRAVADEIVRVTKGLRDQQLYKAGTDQQRAARLRQVEREMAALKSSLNGNGHTNGNGKGGRK